MISKEVMRFDHITGNSCRILQFNNFYYLQCKASNMTDWYTISKFKILIAEMIGRYIEVSNTVHKINIKSLYDSQTNK